MSRMEKIAWYNLAIFGLVFAVFMYVYYIYAAHFGADMRLAFSIRSFALLILMALGPVLFKEKEDKLGKEPDAGRSLRQKLILIGGIVIFYIFLRKGMSYLKGLDYARDNPEYILAFVFLCVLAFVAFVYYRYKKTQENSTIDMKDQGAFGLFLYGPNMDERDILLARRSNHYGLTAFWIYYAGMFVWAILHVLYQANRTISIDIIYVIALFVTGVNIFVFVASIAIIILCRREGFAIEKALNKNA